MRVCSTLKMAYVIDLTGQTFGQWTVLTRAKNTSYRATRWHCRCSCGEKSIVFGDALRGGHSLSCGHITDMVGEKFGRWIVISRAKNMTSRNPRWKCRCSCGTIKTVQGESLRNGQSTSCGCYHREFIAERNTTHGQTGTPEFNAWINMRRRCNDPDFVHYHRYGGRGIKVCKRWQDSFENFFADVGPCPRGRTLDRINNDGDYKPSNVQWATRKQQTAPGRRDLRWRR
jgi:hypothetical protein